MPSAVCCGDPDEVTGWDAAGAAAACLCRVAARAAARAAAALACAAFWARSRAIAWRSAACRAAASLTLSWRTEVPSTVSVLPEAAADCAPAKSAALDTLAAGR